MFAEFGVLNYLTYLVGAIFIILVPGPNTFFVLKTGIAHGVKKGYLAAAGVFIGDAVLMFLAFAGVATLIKTTPVLFNIVRYLGAIYLLWMGAKMLYAVLTQRDGHSDRPCVCRFCRPSGDAAVVIVAAGTWDRPYSDCHCLLTKPLQF